MLNPFDIVEDREISGAEEEEKKSSAPLSSKSPASLSRKGLIGRKKVFILPLLVLLHYPNLHYPKSAPCSVENERRRESQRECKREKNPIDRPSREYATLHFHSTFHSISWSPGASWRKRQTSAAPELHGAGAACR